MITHFTKYHDHVVEAFAGITDSFFKTSEGKILNCGSNGHGKLMLKDANREDIYPPVETTITCKATFCILGSGKSVVFMDVEPPPNTPNRKVNLIKSVKKPKSANKSAKVPKEVPKEIQKEVPIETQKNVPKDIQKNVPKETQKNVPKETQKMFQKKFKKKSFLF